MTLSALIAEDHTVVAEGLQAVLSSIPDLEVVGVADTAEKAIELTSQHPVDLVLMDLNFGPGMSGMEATRVIKERNPKTKVLILTMYMDSSTVAEAIRAGADGYLAKSSSKEDVVQAIGELSAGRSFLHSGVAGGLFGRISGGDAQSLSDREVEVLQAIAHGRSTREAASDMHVSEETLKAHLKHVFRKLGVRDRAEAVAEGFRRGLIR